MVSVFHQDRGGDADISRRGEHFFQPIGHPDSRHLGAWLHYFADVLRSRLMICRMISFSDWPSVPCWYAISKAPGNLHRSGPVWPHGLRNDAAKNRGVQLLAIRIMEADQHDKSSGRATLKPTAPVPDAMVLAGPHSP